MDWISSSSETKEYLCILSVERLTCSMSVIQMAFGEIEYQDMEDNNPVFGPILFIVFAFFVGIVLESL